jgi:hypothetical protein
MGNVYLLGPDSDIWDNPDHSDLIVLKRRNNHSLVSRVLSDFLIRWYHHLLGWRLRVITTIVTVMSNNADWMIETRLNGNPCQHCLLLPGHPAANKRSSRYCLCLSPPCDGYSSPVLC